MSANDVPEDVQKFCYNWRIIVIEPSKLPNSRILLELSDYSTFAEELDEPVIWESERVLPSLQTDLNSFTGTRCIEWFAEG